MSCKVMIELNRKMDILARTKNFYPDYKDAEPFRQMFCYYLCNGKCRSEYIETSEIKK